MINWYGCWALFKRECRRFINVWAQTLGAPLISAMLYFVVFGAALGSRIGITDGVPYTLYLIPGLAAMGMIQHSYQNTSSSLIQMRYLGMLDADFLALPLTPLQIVLAFVSASMVRGTMVGSVILLVSWCFFPYSIAHPLLFILSSLVISAIFGLIGFISGMWARSFDNISFISNFILTPMVYFGGVFFSISMLPEGWRTVAIFNPVFYAVDMFRYAMINTGQSAFYLSSSAAIGIMAGLFILAVWLVNRGWRIKA
ncbi:MAG: ABC transporter permease [Magnetococcales bacterium]|nr:ABC transporter permease [Magnetococcales bacterium]